MAIKILSKKFKKHKCPAIESCPVGALTQKDVNSPPIVNSSLCIECGICVTACHNGDYVLEK